MTWQFDLIYPTRFDPDRYVLLRSTDEGVSHGYATQRMAMWEEDGAPILLARQSVAVFG